MVDKLILDNQFLSAAFALIDSAQQSIFISSYKFQPFCLKRNKKINILFNILCLKRKNGITVNIILNKEQPIRGVSRHNIASALMFKDKNIECRYLRQSRCCHAKIILVDGTHYYIGSHNFSEHAISRNFEAGLCGSNPVVSRQLRIVTTGLWSASVTFGK